MADSWAARVKAMRSKLGLTQIHFAALVGVGTVSANRWEKGHTIPTGRSVTILELLSNVLDLHPPKVIVSALRKAGSDPLEVIRMLVWLERHPTRPARPRPRLSMPPPSSARRPPLSLPPPSSG